MGGRHLEQEEVGGHVGGAVGPGEAKAGGHGGGGEAGEHQGEVAHKDCSCVKGGTSPTCYKPKF